MDKRNFISQVRQYKQLEMRLGSDYSEQVKHLMELHWQTVMAGKPTIDEQEAAWAEISDLVENEYLPRHPDLVIGKPAFQADFL